MADKLIDVNGEILAFPDSMTDDQIKSVLAKKFPKKTEATAKGSDGQTIPSISVDGVANEPAPITNSYLKGLKDPLDAGAQLLPRGLSAITSLGGIVPNMFSDWLDKEAAKVDATIKQEEQAYQANRKSQGSEGFDWGRLAGNVINPANIAVGARAAGLVAPTKAVVGGVLAGAAGGAMSPVADTEGEDSFAEQKAKQVAGGAIFGGAGAAVVKGAGHVLNPVVTKAEQMLLDMGVPLTPGMLLGGKTKNIEDFAKNLPLVGSKIEDAQQRSLFAFNKAVINRALGNVGESLPDDVVGRDAVKYTNKVISDKYDEVLSKTQFTYDRATNNKITNTLRTNRLPASAQNAEVLAILKKTVNDKIIGKPSISGEAYKDIESDLLKEAEKYASSVTAHDRNIGEVLYKVLGDLKDSLAVQNPTQADLLKKVNKAYGEVVVMKTAAANTGAENGVFTPKQFLQAARQNDGTMRKGAFASGNARSQEIADAAVEVMGKHGESTLEGRLAVGAIGGYATLTNPYLAIPAAVSVPFLYSEAGINALTAIMTKRPEIAKKIGENLTKNASKLGGITSAQVLREYNRLTQTEKE
jgi:hypothetical protein